MAVLSMLIFAGCGGGGSRTGDAERTATDHAAQFGLIVQAFDCQQHPGLESGHGTSWFLCTGAVQSDQGTQPGTLTVACADGGPCRING